MPAVPGCAEMLIFQGRIKLVLFKAFSVQCWCMFWQLGWYPSALLLPPPSFLWELCRLLLSWRCLEPPCVGAISKYWSQVVVLPSASHHSQVEMKAQREAIHVIERWKWGIVFGWYKTVEPLSWAGTPESFLALTAAGDQIVRCFNHPNLTTEGQNGARGGLRGLWHHSCSWVQLKAQFRTVCRIQSIHGHRRPVCSQIYGQGLQNGNLQSTFGKNYAGNQ